MDITTDITAEVLIEVTAEVAIEVTGRTELNFNYSSGDL